MTEERDIRLANIIMDLAETNLFLSGYFGDRRRIKKARCTFEKAEKEIKIARKLLGNEELSDKIES